MKPFVPLATLTDDEIRDRLADVIAHSLRLDPSKVTPSASLFELGAESIDVVEITLEVESAFAVLMPEHTILELATELAGEGVFEKEGCLTARGCELIRARMPGLDDPSLVPGRPVRELGQLFLRVDVWARVIRALLEATPRVCPSCDGRLVQGGPERVRCVPCAREYDVPSGDEIGRAWLRTWLATRSA